MVKVDKVLTTSASKKLSLTIYSVSRNIRPFRCIVATAGKGKSNTFLYSKSSSNILARGLSVAIYIAWPYNRVVALTPETQYVPYNMLSSCTLWNLPFCVEWRCRPKPQHAVRKMQYQVNFQFFSPRHAVAIISPCKSVTHVSVQFNLLRFKLIAIHHFENYFAWQNYKMKNTITFPRLHTIDKASQTSISASER